ncbi:MAG: glycoside hydrolase family 13 protein, partial [Oscillospiraceae bacterium]|nr:glycoside hydrolase family 13 protein [Oscillospiraceae bacterium]
MAHATFDSRDSRCKAPFGAVPCGTQISLTLRPPLAEGFLACTLVLRAEFSQERQEIPLCLTGVEDDRQVFAGSYSAPTDPELIWYCFRFHRNDSTVLFLGKEGFSTEEDKTVTWQQTVYDDTLSTPGWFGRGVTYQIFPDRFRRPAAPLPSGLPEKRVLHPNWDEDMSFLAQRDGETQNHDYFGGNLAGVEEKLPHLRSLGVSTIYFCPIFEADSNHRYNTGDYEKIDPLLGTEEDFRRLCAKAKALGIHVMLDGVFNHTGSNSRYFNAEGTYPTLGAAQSQDSPYFPWYTFQKWPTQYDSWWGFHTLPAVNESHPDYIAYIIEGEDSIIRRWLRVGADAWMSLIHL